MWKRFAWGALLLGVALGCNDGDELSDPGTNGGGAGSSGHGGGAHAGAAGAGAFAGSGVAGEGGSRDVETPGGAGGDLAVGGDTSQGGEGGVASVHFFSDQTQHIELQCFGFFAGDAWFRADRAQLSAAQLDLLANSLATPGSTYDGNDDAIHCRVSTTDATHSQQHFVDPSGLVGRDMIGGEAGAAGAPDTIEYRESILGCDFHSEFAEDPPGGLFEARTANPLCVRELDPDGKVSTFSFDLAKADTPYHLDLINCAAHTFDQVKVELYGADAAIPLAVGAAPADPGPDQACLAFDAQVTAPVVGHLVFTSVSARYDASFYAVFR